MDNLTSELLAGYAMAGVGGFVVIRYLRRLCSAWGSQEWLATSGRVTRSALVRKVYCEWADRDEGLVLYRADISYCYCVGGVEYKSDRAVFGQDMTMLGKWMARKLVDRWPAGMTVTVYYDAADPTDAVLDPKSRWRLYPLLVIALAFTLAGIALLAWSFK